MEAVYRVIYWVHVPVALPTAVLFWLPVLARKGSRLHRVAGRAWAFAMIYVACTGSLMGAIWVLDPLGRPGADAAPDPAHVALFHRSFGVFLLYLGTITGVPVWHGWRIAATRKDPMAIRTRTHGVVIRLPLVGSIAVLLVAWLARPPQTPVLLAMSPIGIGLTLLFAAYRRAPTTPRLRWWTAHMTAMLIGGIAAYTATGLFALARMMHVHVEGPFAALPWIGPTLVGVPVIAIWTRRTRRRFARPGPTA